MPALQWSEDFVLDLAPMDTTHQEFVELLATVEDASDGALMHAWQHLVEHTDDHFSRERPLDGRYPFFQQQLPHHATQHRAAGHAAGIGTRS